MKTWRNNLRARIRTLAATVALTFFAVCSAHVQAAVDLVTEITMPAGSDWLTNMQYPARVTVSNVGDEDAANVTVNVPIPAGVDWQGIPDVDQDPGVFISGHDWATLDLLPAGQSIRYTYFISSSIPGSYTLTAEATTTETDPTPENNSAIQAISVMANYTVDLAVSISATPNQIALFGTTTVVATCTNTSNTVARDVNFTVMLNHHGVLGRGAWELVSATSTKGNVQADSLYIVNHGFALQPGESAVITAEVKALWVGDLALRTEVQSLQSLDSNFSDNEAGMSVNVQGTLPNFDIAASMKLSPSVVQPGGLIVQQMTVTNLGPDDATSLTLYTQIDNLTSPFGTIEGTANLFLDHIVDSGPWSIWTQHHIFQAKLPFLAAGDSASVTLVMRVKDTVATGALTHHCQVSSDWWYEGGIVPVWNGDIFNLPAQNSFLANNNASAQVQVNLSGAGDQSDLEITRTAPLEAPVGQAYSYTVRAKNNGPHPTSSAFISNVLSDNLNVVSVLSDKGTASVAGGFVALEDAPLAVGESATLLVTVVPRQVGEEVYSGTVASAAFDPNLANNSTNATTLITADGPVVNPDVPCMDMPDLVAQMIKVSRKGKFKKKTGEWQFKVQAKVAVTNIGTGCAMGKSTVRLYLSEDTILDSSDMVIGGKQIKKLCPPKKANKAPKPKKVSIKAKLAPGVNPVGMYLIAVVDADNGVFECNEANNIALTVE